MKPRAWGRHFWYTIHFVALGYPEQPSDIDKQHYTNFFSNIQHVLPCTKCSENYSSHLEELPLANYLTNRDLLFAWTVQLHNIVNHNLGKESWSIEQAKAFYDDLSKGNGEALNISLLKQEKILCRIILIINVVLLALILAYMLYKRYTFKMRSLKAKISTAYK